MKQKAFEKYYEIADTNYQCKITCNQLEDGAYAVYGKLIDENGITVKGISPTKKNAKSIQEAKQLIDSIKYLVSCKIPNRKTKAARLNNKTYENDIDNTVKDLLERNVCFYTAAEAGSIKKSWNENTHHMVYTYWLHHGFSGLVIRMSESEDPAAELECFRNDLIENTFDHGRSKKKRDQVELTVKNSIYRMNILSSYLHRLHPEIPPVDLTKGMLFSRAIPQEQIKALPENMCIYLTKELESNIEKKPEYVLCAILMYDGALRTAEAAGIRLDCIIFYENYCVVKVLYQEKNGERTERLKTVNAYRYVILSYWASVMIKKCLDIMGLDSSDDRLLVTGQNLSRWIRNILMNYDEAFVTEMESIERTNPDYDEDGKPIYDISAYALRRNAASRWLNYDGLTHDEIDIMLGHKDKGGQPVIYLMDESDQQRIADKLEHYVYNQKYTRNPAFQPYNVTSETQMDLNPYPVHRIVNGSGKKMRIRLDLLSCCPDEAIDLIVPRGATGEPICRSEPIKLENRIVVNANYDPHKGEFDNENV